MEAMLSGQTGISQFSLDLLRASVLKRNCFRQAIAGRDKFKRQGLRLTPLTSRQRTSPRSGAGTYCQ